VQKIRETQRQFHLKEPIVARYWLWAKGTVTGSPDTGAPILPGGRAGIAFRGRIWPAVWTAAKHTAVLMAISLVVVVALSVLVGTIAAVRPRSPLDLVLRTGSYLAWSVPAFLLALGLQYVFTELEFRHHFQPFALAGLPGSTAGTGLHWLRTWAQYLTLPVLAIAAGFVGAYSRYVRSALLVSLGQPYAVTARAKGLTERRVVLRHALRNSLVPFVSILTLDFGAVFGATLVADYVFKQQGIAAYLVGALYDADPYEVMPAILVVTAVVLAFSLVADLAVGWLDPRVRSGVG
jgi:peptide/nickel transport system permease protein